VPVVNLNIPALTTSALLIHAPKKKQNGDGDHAKWDYTDIFEKNVFESHTVPDL
jgi:hypothetical protein